MTAEPSGHGFLCVSLAFLLSSSHLPSNFGPAALWIAPHTEFESAKIFLNLFIVIKYLLLKRFKFAFFVIVSYKNIFSLLLLTSPTTLQFFISCVDDAMYRCRQLRDVTTVDWKFTAWSNLRSCFDRLAVWLKFFLRAKKAWFLTHNG